MHPFASEIYGEYVESSILDRIRWYTEDKAPQTRAYIEQGLSQLEKYLLRHSQFQAWLAARKEM